MCCVYSLESSSLQHTIILLKTEKTSVLLLFPFVSWSGAVINPHRVEIPMSRMNFHGPKDDRAIEIRLYQFFLPFLVMITQEYVCKEYVWSVPVTVKMFLQHLL